MGKPSKPKRRRIDCQYTMACREAIRFVRRIEDEFVCPGCGSSLKRGSVFRCKLCDMEIGVCCQDEHLQRIHVDVVYDVSEYLPPLTCTKEGHSRCWCCSRFVCRDHFRNCKSSDIPTHTSLFGEFENIILCSNCQSTLIPEPLPEEQI